MGHKPKYMLHGQEYMLKPLDAKSKEMLLEWSGASVSHPLDDCEPYQRLRFMIARELIRDRIRKLKRIRALRREGKQFHTRSKYVTERS